jgi:glyoxylase-like metal-dependent hydrolase (beta-lactamase superfamily II)
MNEKNYTSLGYGITCIDAAYVSPGMACFYLMEERGEYAVLETGTSHSAAVLWQLLRERDIALEQVRYVIPTHVHLDHAGGAGAIMAALPNAQLLIHPRGARHMADPERLVSAAKAVYGEALFHTLYGEVEPIAPARMRQMQDGETVSLGGRQLEFRHTRGHAEHHFCVWDALSQGWFSGDMFGVSYPWCRFPQADFVLPSTTPSQFDPEAYLISLELLAGYSPKRMYLTHYGELAYSAEKSQLLARQIETYCEFATADSLEATVLQQRLSEYTLELLNEFDARGDEAEFRRHIAFDMQLNAQGLQMWRQRSATT